MNVIGQRAGLARVIVAARRSAGFRRVERNRDDASAPRVPKEHISEDSGRSHSVASHHTVVTFLQNDHSLTVSFCGDRTNLFPTDQAMAVHFNPGPPCATVIAAVLAE